MGVSGAGDPADWQSLLEALPAAHALVDASGAILASNSGWSRRAAACPLAAEPAGPEAPRAGYVDHLEAQRGHAPESMAIAAALRRVLAGEPGGPDIDHSCEAGGERRVLAFRVAAAGAAGPARAVITIDDVSDRRRAERALGALGAAASAAVGDALLRPLTRQVAVLLGVRCAILAKRVSPTRLREIVVWTGEGWSEGGEREVAGTASEAVLEGRTCHHERGLAAIFPGDERSRELGWESYLGVPLRSQDGEVVGVLAALDPAPLPGHRVEHDLLQALADRAAVELSRVAAEEALRRSERRLLLSLEGTSDGLFDWNVKTGEIYGSPRLTGMLGYAPGEIEPTIRAWEALTHPDDLATAREAIAAHLRGDTPSYEAEVRLRCKSGGWLWVLDRGKVVERDARGWALRMAGTHTDISARKRMELQLLVSDRMASLGTLAACVAHEINNPLACALGSLDVVGVEAMRLGWGDADRGRLAPAIDLARESIARVLEIAADLKAFSRVEEVDRREPVDVRAVLDRAIRLANNEIRHRATLRRSYAEVPPVEANASRLGQVFLNLLVNAAQAIRTGDSGSNWIAVTVASDAGKVVVEIADSGEGMERGVRARIFEPFFTTKATGAGVGLGLSICQGIVAGLGGEIAVESAPGAGSRFRVTLPASARAATPAPASAPPISGPRRRVLVVDDEVGIGVTLRLLLGEAHDVVALTSGRAALEALRGGQRFDAILCDLMMPTFSGIDLYGALRELAPEQASRMVFMTGGVFTANARAFLDAVPNAVLEKPFDVSRIEAILRGEASAR